MKQSALSDPPQEDVKLGQAGKEVVYVSQCLVGTTHMSGHFELLLPHRLTSDEFQAISCGFHCKSGIK